MLHAVTDWELVRASIQEICACRTCQQSCDMWSCPGIAFCSRIIDAKDKMQCRLPQQIPSTHLHILTVTEDITVCKVGLVILEQTCSDGHHAAVEYM